MDSVLLIFITSIIIIILNRKKDVSRYTRIYEIDSIIPFLVFILYFLHNKSNVLLVHCITIYYEILYIELF